MDSTNCKFCRSKQLFQRNEEYDMDMRTEFNIKNHQSSCCLQQQHQSSCCSQQHRHHHIHQHRHIHHHHHHHIHHHRHNQPQNNNYEEDIIRLTNDFTLLRHISTHDEDEELKKVLRQSLLEYKRQPKIIKESEKATHSGLTNLVDSVVIRIKKECPICIEKFKLNEKRTILPCFHDFHSDCINKWLKENNTCPICKKILYNKMAN